MPQRKGFAQSNRTMTDEIMTELHGVKDAIGAEFNFDMRALFEDIKRGGA